MQFQWTDLVVLAIMLISGLLALARGFTREVLSLIAWASPLSPVLPAPSIRRSWPWRSNISRRRLPPRSR